MDDIQFILYGMLLVASGEAPFAVTRLGAQQQQLVFDGAFEMLYRGS
jgi:hypothetical protein